MKSRLIVAAIGVPVTFVLLFVLPEWGTLVFCAAISAVGAHEMTSAAKTGTVSSVLAIISALGISVCAFFSSLAAAAAVGAVYVLAVFFLWVLRYERGEAFGVPGLGAALMAGILVPAGMAALIALRETSYGRYTVLLPVIISFAGDGGAYFIGLKFGRHKLCPATSPKKTIEGAVGGLIVGALVCAAFLAALRVVSGGVIAVVSALALVVGLVSELGDLAFSLIKRELGIKDYGRLLPGHGGALDRFDSMVFSAPAVLLLFTLLGKIA